MQNRTKGEERQRQIVSITLELLATTSLEGLTTRQIAGALGITQPALFRHFRSRDELFVAVIADIRTRMAELVESVLQDGGPREQLRSLMIRLFEYTESHPGLSALLFSSALPAEGPVRQALKHIIAMQAGLVAALVVEGQRTGEFDTTVEADHTATAFTALLQGTIFQWRLSGQATKLSENASALYDLWLDGAGGSAVSSVSGTECKGSVDPSAWNRAATGSAIPRETEPQIRELDVRPVIASGEDPQAQISRHIDSLPPGSVLVVVAPFRPTPLVTLLSKHGHGVNTVQYGPDHFQVDIVVGGAPGIEDLRDLEPPEPLERILERGTHLEEGSVYLARLPRFPRLLLPHLKDRGLAHSLYDTPDESVLLLIRKATS